MEVLRSFVIRIYANDAAESAGVLEIVESREVLSFRTADELYALLSMHISGRRLHHPDPGCSGN